MARIRFNIASALSRWPRRRLRGEVSEQRFRMMNLEALREMALGPGWFDSSWDLGQGLEVDIVLPDDPAFAAWLEALTRMPEPAAAAAAGAVAGAAQPVLAPQDMLEFEPIDWQAWSPAERMAADPLPDLAAAGPSAPRLDPELELPDLTFEPEPRQELELALVPI
jgi:hypothetical protein